MAEIKKISTEFQLLDKFLDTSGDAGTSGQVLSSTATGINWVSGSSLPGGPYLPLVGGTMNTNANINMNSGSLSSVDYIDFGIGQLNGVSTSNLILKSLGDITYNVDSNNNGNSSHIFQESGSELMRIRYDGNVGIGTTSPGTLHGVTYGTTKLHVDGGTDRGQMILEGDSLAGIIMSDNGATANERVFSTMVDGGNYQIKPLNDNGTSTAGGAAITVLHNSNVGIGETSPDFRLDVSKGYTSGNGKVAKFRSGNDATFVNFDTVQVVQTDVPCLAIIETSTGTQADEQKLTFAVGDNKAIIGSTSTVTNGMSFYTNRAVTTTGFTAQGNLALHLANAGNVGINTTNPQAFTKLDVRSGDADGNAAIAGYGYNGVGGLGVLGHAYAVDNAHAGSATGIRGISNGGRTVSGSVNIGGYFTAAGSENNYALITDSGNVGIGAAAPLRKLHVVGNFAVNAATDEYYGVNISGGEGSDPKITIGDWHNSGSTLQWDSSARSLNLDTQYSTSAGTFNITGNDGASTFLTILPSGNVGIGTTSPGAKLEIAGFSTGQGLKMNYGNSSGTIEAVNFIANGGANGVIGMQMVSAGVGDLWLGGSNGRSLTLYRDGNVGIGTSTPNAKLDVQGTQGQLFSVTDDLSGDIFSVADISGVPIMNVNSSGVSYFDGSLGIGTDSPKTKLNIVGGDVQLDSGQMLSFYTGASTGVQNNGIKGSDVDDSLRFYTGALERVTIKGANVGIGTITPGAKLDVEGSYGDVIKAVSGSQSITTNFVAPSGSSGLNNIISTAGRFNIGTSDAQPFSLLTNSISRIAILSDGKVGIGVTNPSYKLEVSGTLGVNRTDGIIFAGSAAGGYGNKITADTSNDFIFSTSLPSAPYTVSEKMRIANGGATTFTSTVTATNFILSSDERLKENVEKVCDNRVKADWKTFELKTEKGQKRYGVIAQELEKTNPEFVREDSQGFKSVAYIDLLIAKIAELEARLEKLEK
jgi:hypothetical protein